MIVALHVATGAAAGAASGSRLAALLLGPILHLAGDRLPHRDIRSRRFEIGSGLAGLLLLAARRGPLDPATLGAAATSAPDLEHVLPFLRPGGRKLFHDRGWHRSGPFPADLQLLLAGAILGALIAPRSRIGLEGGRMTKIWGLSKRDANYGPAPTPDVRCDRCKYMFPPLALGGCRLVRGVISGSASCKEFVPRRPARTEPES